VWGASPKPALRFLQLLDEDAHVLELRRRILGECPREPERLHVEDDWWACVEVHANLNTDMGSAAGAALEVWKNDVLVQRFPETGANGYWGAGPLLPGWGRWLAVRLLATVPGPLDIQFRSSARCN